MTNKLSKLCVVLLGTVVILTGCKSPVENPVPPSSQPSAETQAVTGEEAMQPAKKKSSADDEQAKSNVTEPAPEAPPAKPAVATVVDPQPDIITVQHILIGYKGSVPGKNISRSKEEAEALAKQILAEAQATGADFDALVKKHTNDSHPGIYSMGNHNMDPSTLPAGVRPRGKMVAAFGDVGFPLEVGEVGIANYDPEKSPFGWHIIKRIK